MNDFFSVIVAQCLPNKTIESHEDFIKISKASKDLENFEEEKDDEELDRSYIYEGIKCVKWSPVKKNNLYGIINGKRLSMWHVNSLKDGKTINATTRYDCHVCKLFRSIVSCHL